MPKVKRFSRCKKQRAKAPTPPKKSQYPAKRKQWTDQQMRDAMEAASSGNISINKASELYGVPKTTLKDRLSRRVVHGTKPGPKPYLRPEEELVDHLTKLSDVGLPKTRREVMQIAENVATAKGMLKAVHISGGWWRRFLERNPGVSSRASDTTAGVRIDAINEENMKKYFDLLEEVYNDLDFKDHPERI
jgi:hypothetical protein